MFHRVSLITLWTVPRFKVIKLSLSGSQNQSILSQYLSVALTLQNHS